MPNTVTDVNTFVSLKSLKCIIFFSFDLNTWKQLSFYASNIQKTSLEGHTNLTLAFMASFVLK